MEENIFHRPEVLRELTKYIELRLHTDADTDLSRKLLDIKLERNDGDITTPIYEIVDPQSGKTLDVFKGADLLSLGKNFAAFLEKNAATRLGGR